MKHTAGLLISLFASNLFNLYSDTINVPADYPTIQQAVDAAAYGDTVLVAPGTYVENIVVLGKSLTIESAEGASKTVIDGGNPVNPDMGSVVAFTQGSDSILRGFTLTNGTGYYYSYHRYGGGVFVENSFAEIDQNNICHNSGDLGGGIWCKEGTVVIIHNRIHDNSLGAYGQGGGICCHENAVFNIINNEISYNSTVGGAGGGVKVSSASGAINGNVIHHNVTGTSGGGIYCWAYDIAVSNNIIHDNDVVGTTVADGRGGGIFFYKTHIVFVNNTLFNNTAHGPNNSEGRGGGLCCKNSTGDMVNSVFWSNNADIADEVFVGETYLPSTVNIEYCNVDGVQAEVYADPGSSCIWGSGMISSDPLFMNFSEQDFHISFLSPCRGSGDNSIVTDPFDFEGDPRIYQGTVDIGADEFYTHLYVTGDKAPGGSIEGKFVGLPGTTPVGLFVGSGILPTPAKTMWGEYHLQAPWFLFTLIPLPSNGILELPTTLPGSIPAPYDIPMQALIGVNADSLTNLYVLEVR